MAYTRENLDGDNRKERFAQIPKGPGVFVYDGSAVDHESTPTILRTHHKEPEYDDRTGLPKMDKAGRQVYKTAGIPKMDNTGRPMLGGPPEIKRIPIDTYRLRGSEFPKGEPVKVNNPRLALKLRTMSCFEEVSEEATKKKGPGRPPKIAAGD